jgi:hypothetical protein
MKNILFLLLICFSAHQFSQAQIIKDSLPANRSIAIDMGMKYLSKSRTQNTVGFVLLGLGLAAITGGIIETTQNLFSSDNTGATFILLGLGATVTSVPFFISGAKNKGKAEILLQYENLFHSGHLPIHTNIASIGIAFNIR